MTIFPRLIIVSKHLTYCLYPILMALYAFIWSPWMTNARQGMVPHFSDFRSSNLALSSLCLKLRMERKF